MEIVKEGKLFRVGKREKTVRRLWQNSMGVKIHSR
jgi:hypothetical protein